MDVFAPARAAAAAGIALFRGRAYVTSSRRRHHGRPVRPRLTGHGIILGVA